jgi:hypothetical protein
MLPFGFSIFCDDIRYELQNKLSLIGCYGVELIVHDTPPVMLPKLCVLVQARLPLEKMPPIKLNVYAFDEEVPLHTVELSAGEEAFDAEAALKNLATTSDSIPHRYLAYPLVLSPFVVPKPGYVKVRIQYGKQTVRAGSLKISHVPASDNTKSASPT